MQLEKFLQPGRILLLDSCKDRGDLFAKLAEKAGDIGPSTEELVSGLESREAEGPTSTPEGVAFPHALVEGIRETVLVVALVRSGTNFRNPDHPLCDVIFCLFGEPSKPYQHVRVLARMARVCRGSGAIDRFRACESEESLYSALVEEDRSHV